MKLAAVQFSPILMDKKSNFEKILNYSKNIEANLIIFPELALTGYFFTSRKETLAMSESFGSETISALQEISSNTGKILVLGFIEEARGKIYNSAAILFPEKKFSTTYRKTHLFYKEKNCFDLGDTGFFVVDYKPFDLKLGTMICYDWRFPEAARTLGLLSADLIVCPSNLVTHIWNLAMPSRAIENKVYLAVANRIGSDEREGEQLSFNGKSAIYGYNGNTLAIASAESEEVIYTEIFPHETRNKSFNDFNDIFKDRRTDMYRR